MKRGALAMLLVATLAVASSACGDGSPISGEYCSPSEASRCTTISFPSKRGTDVPGTMQIDGRRYEVRWMDTENGRRTYIANLPGGTIAFDMSAVDARTVAVRWRDKRPEQTYALK
jgi:hypothetical protein